MTKQEIIEFLKEEVLEIGKDPDYDVEYDKIEAAGFKVTTVEQVGGEGEGEHYHEVMKFEKEGEDPFYVMCEAAYYMSYDGVTWDGGQVYEAKQVEVVKKEFQKV